MNISTNTKRSPGFRTMIAGGVLAGTLGLAISQGTPGGAPSETEPGTAQDKTMGMPGASSDQVKQSQSGSSQPGSVSTTDRASTGMNAGWRIRVCTEKTQAQSISFTLSPDPAGRASNQGADKPSSSDPAAAANTNTSGSDMASGNTPQSASTTQSASTKVSWNRGESTILSVPASLGVVDRIRLEAVPGEKDQQASICVLYNDHVAKKLNFDERKVSMIRKTETGECGC